MCLVLNKHDSNYVMLSIARYRLVANDPSAVQTAMRPRARLAPVLQGALELRSFVRWQDRPKSGTLASNPHLALVDFCSLLAHSGLRPERLMRRSGTDWFMDDGTLSLSQSSSVPREIRRHRPMRTL